MKRVPPHFFVTALPLLGGVAVVLTLMMSTQASRQNLFSVYDVESSVDNSVVTASESQDQPVSADARLPFVEQVELQAIQLNKQVNSRVDGEEASNATIGKHRIAQASGWDFHDTRFAGEGKTFSDSQFNAIAVADEQNVKPEMIGASYTAIIYTYPAKPKNELDQLIATKDSSRTNVSDDEVLYGKQAATVDAGRTYSF